MRMPTMNNYMTQTLTLNYLTGGSCISLMLQTNDTEVTVRWSIPPNTRARLHKTPVTTTGIRTCTRNLSQLHEIT